MATLGNILARKGETAITGRSVTLTLILPNVGGSLPIAEEATLLLLPVSIVAQGKADRAAKEYVAEREAAGETIDLSKEKQLRFMLEAMRNVDDARQYFVDSKSIELWRNIIIDEQLTVLVREYETLIMSEYPEVRAHVETMKAEAAQTFTTGQD